MSDNGAPRTRVEKTFTALRNDIVNGEFEPGSRLAVEHLRQRYEVGSSTIREALSLLIADALVTAEGQRGFTVKPLTAADLRDLSQVRILLETKALTESIENGDDEWEAGIVATFHRLSKAQERVDAGEPASATEWETRNSEFHDALTARSGSKWIRYMLDMLNHHSERYRRAALLDTSVPRNVHAEHTALMNAALERDVDAACQVVTDHIWRTSEIIAELTEAGEAEAKAASQAVG